MMRTCITCGDTFKGRADKIFCGDYCRNQHNNNLNRDSKNLVRNVNNRLRKNYRILEDINAENKTKTTKEKLLRLGFSFEFFTSIYTTKTGSIYFYVYDQGYLPLDNNFFLLVKKDFQ